MSEDDIDFSLVQKFLKEIQSKLQEHADEKEPAYFYDKLKLLRYVGDKRIGDQLYKVWVPRNVALLLFNPSPHEFFRGAKTEIAIYTHDNETEEKCITGPIDQQIREVLSFILKTTKEEACHEFVAYPERALREAVVNAFHHRGYEDENCDPIKIHIKPDYIDVISYPGPSPSLTKEHFKEGGEVPCVPSRNRRIAEFLKEKKLAEARFTGVKTIFKSMKQNSNPKPAFDFTSEQFRVRLPGHPKYIAYSVIRKVDNLCAKGDKQDAVNILKDFLDENLSTCPDMIIRKLLELFDNDQTHPDVQPYQKFISEKLQRTSPLITELCKWCVSEEMPDITIGVEIVNKLAKEGATSDDLDSVIRKAADLCQRRSDNREQVLEAAQNAHKLFEAMGADITQTNAFAAFQFACCKFTLYVKKCRNERQRKVLICYLKEAEDYVHKAKQLTREEYKHHLANQYRQLGYIHSQLFLIQKSTVERIKNFYDKARHYNSEIKISNIFIPAELRSFYMPLGSPTREINHFDPIE